MLRIKQHKCIVVGIIVLGVILLGMPAVYAQDDSNVPEWVGSANEEVNSYDTDQEEGDLEALGDLYEDLVYTPVPPCKIVDTRFGGGGFIAAGATRYYNVLNTSGQGGDYCSSPVGYPSAVHLSVTVVNPNGQGNLKVFPANADGTTGLQVNFAPIGTNLANAGTTRVVYGSGDDIGVKTQYAGCDVTIMVLGYYTRPEATQLQVQQYKASQSVGPGKVFAVYSPKCKTGYIATGGGCAAQYGGNKEDIAVSRPYPDTGVPLAWECRGINNESYTQVFDSHVICVRIPGR